MKTEKRQIVVENFVRECLGSYNVLSYDVIINDDSEKYYTDFEIIIRNTTNEKSLMTILRCDLHGSIEIMRGDEMYPTDQKDFIIDLFLSQFLTFIEV